MKYTGERVVLEITPLELSDESGGRTKGAFFVLSRPSQDQRLAACINPCMTFGEAYDYMMNAIENQRTKEKEKRHGKT